MSSGKYTHTYTHTEVAALSAVYDVSELKVTRECYFGTIISTLLIQSYKYQISSTIITQHQ
jgi:hypothetical protein